MEEGSSDGEERAQANHLKKRARKNKSVVVVFDADARKEFVTGFRKRKIQRRKVAEAQKEKKDRQKRLLERKERRATIKEARGGAAKSGADEEQVEEEAGDVEVNGGPASVADTVVYEYGDTLTTVTTSAIVPEEEEAAPEADISTDNESLQKATPTAQLPPQLEKQVKPSSKRKQKHPGSHRKTPLKSSKRKRTDNGKTPAKLKRRRK